MESRETAASKELGPCKSSLPAVTAGRISRVDVEGLQLRKLRAEHTFLMLGSYLFRLDNWILAGLMIWYRIDGHWYIPGQLLAVSKHFPRDI
jgi:hypothetical protein